jgi:hypothetical protein
VLANPAYPETIWKLTPDQSGRLPVAANRGGPINIEWEVHGTGDIKLVVRLVIILFHGHVPEARARIAVGRPWRRRCCGVLEFANESSG